ncbi:MAG: hypothetical protein AMXMBFR53_22810 [Gemmatimonadota bacterium]
MRLRHGWWVGALLAVAALHGAPAPAGAQVQTLEQLVVQRRLELRAARDTYQSARSSFTVAEQQFSAALTELNAARRSGDNDRLDRAHAVARDRSVPYRSQEQRLEEALASVAAARTALIEALSARLEQLLAEMDAAPSAQQRRQLDILFRDLSNELQALEAEEAREGDTFRIDPVVLPEITFDPRDGPEELAAKAGVLERQAAIADSTIADTERQVQALNSRLRIQRQTRDLLASTDRFDDTRVPVTTGPPAGERPAVTDSTVAGARPLTLEERIQNLREYITQLQSYRDQLLIRAEQFRRRVGAVA